MFNMSTIGDYIKKERKKAGLTQEDFAIRSGLGLRFVRELEQGKETVRLDKEDAVAVSLTLPLRQEPGSRNFQLSKAYDMLPVNVIMPEDKEQLALTINGKKRNIHKKEFRILAESCGIPLNSAERMMKKVCSLKTKLFTQIEESYLSAEQKEQIEELISKRLDILS